MKICPNCQQVMEDSFTTCENCGADVVTYTEEMASKDFSFASLKNSEEDSEEAESDEKKVDFPEVSRENQVTEQAPVPAKRTPSAFAGRTPGSMPRPAAPRAAAPARASNAARRSTPGSIRRRQEVEEAEESAQNDVAAPSSVVSGINGTTEAESLSSISEEANHFAPDTTSEETTSFTHKAPTLQQKLMKRDHPEWDMDSMAKKESSFTPVPPFVSQEEAERPSPFAPAKNTATSEKAAAPRGKASLDIANNPAKRIDTSADSGELAVSVRLCPSCKSRCLSTDSTCRNCGYRFPKAGALAAFNDKSINILAMLAALAMAASIFTNIINYKLDETMHTVKLIDSYHGFGFLALAALTIVLAISGKNIPIVVTGILSALAATAENYYLWYDITQVKKGGHVNQEIGFWLLAAGAGLIFISGIVGIMKEKKKREKITADYLKSI